ncbi:hypothetical protein Hypma_013982 [Hypsizygus marmoreus]|uniref:Uncharacterized protein n=1 Tax=Hypsizygus marmoreus TaxID=39966 RepID=A0A369KEH0_HYPMA|nr:hypothetical protein Hypma_013982 [Hypsizygus marmoreus]
MEGIGLRAGTPRWTRPSSHPSRTPDPFDHPRRHRTRRSEKCAAIWRIGSRLGVEFCIHTFGNSFPNAKSL